MTDSEHAEISQLSGLAALRALAPEDEQRVADHLRRCAICRATFAEQRAAADLLLRLPEPVEPSPELKGRIMAAIVAEPQGGHGDAETGRRGAGAPPLSVSPRPPVPLSPRPTRRRWDWRELGLAASVAAALFFGYSTWRLQNDVAAVSARLAQQEAVVRAATQGRVVQMAATGASPQVRGAVAESGDATYVYLDGLPTPPHDQAYQVWLIPPGGQPVGAGLSEPGHGGTQTIRLHRGLAGMQQVAVTQEPAGGSPGPTSQVLVAARL